MPNKHLALAVLLLSTVALAAPPEPIDAGKTTANVFESTFFHFRYELPKGWLALDDNYRLAENKKHYETELQAAHEQNGPDTDTLRSEVIVPYFLSVASRTAVTASDTTQMPRVVILASMRRIMMQEPGDPAKLIVRVARPKILKEPEEVVLSGHKFVRADFEFRPVSLLSKFTTVIGDYIIEFDLRADNEKDLAELVNTMQSLQFSDK